MMLRCTDVDVIFFPMETQAWADEGLKGGIGKTAVDFAASFEMIQINQLSVVAFWYSSGQAIKFGKYECEREALSIYLVACW